MLVGIVQSRFQPPSLEWLGPEAAHLDVWGREGGRIFFHLGCISLHKDEFYDLHKQQLVFFLQPKIKVLSISQNKKPEGTGGPEQGFQGNIRRVEPG